MTTNDSNGTATDGDMDRAERISSRRSDRRARSGRDRGERSQRAESDESDQSAQTSQTTLKDLNHVAIYLDDEHKEMLDLWLDELALEYKKEFGEDLGRNRDAYPAIVRSLVNGTTVREELGLED